MVTLAAAEHTRHNSQDKFDTCARRFGGAHR